MAIDQETKLIPVYTVGKRTEETTWYFLNDLAERLSTRILKKAFGSDVDFAQLIKLYGEYGQHGFEHTPQAQWWRSYPESVTEGRTRLISARLMWSVKT